MMTKGARQFTFFLLTGILRGFVFLWPSFGPNLFEQLTGSRSTLPSVATNEGITLMDQRIVSLSANSQIETLDASALRERFQDLKGDLNHPLIRVEDLVAQLDEVSDPTEQVREINTPVSRESERSAEEFKQWVETISSETDDKKTRSANDFEGNQLDNSGESNIPQ